MTECSSHRMFERMIEQTMERVSNDLRALNENIGKRLEVVDGTVSRMTERHIEAAGRADTMEAALEALLDRLSAAEVKLDSMSSRINQGIGVAIVAGGAMSALAMLLINHLMGR